MLDHVLGQLVGFMLGVLLRRAAGAIVGYFVFSLLLPTLCSVLAETQAWFGSLTGEQAQLAVTTGVWLVRPLLLGLRLVLRSEVT